MRSFEKDIHFKKPLPFVPAITNKLKSEFHKITIKKKNLPAAPIFEVITKTVSL